MKNTTKSLLLLLVLLFCLNQIMHTVFDSNNFPFSAYNMFNFNVPQKTYVLKAILYQENGEKIVADLGNILPVEFFRANDFIREVYIRNNDIEQQKQFSRLIIDRLNNDPWNHFDERLASTRPTNNHYFVGFEIVEFYKEYNFSGRSENVPTSQPGQTLYMYWGTCNNTPD